jgi:hypothetical protein
LYARLIEEASRRRRGPETITRRSYHVAPICAYLDHKQDSFTEGIHAEEELSVGGGKRRSTLRSQKYLWYGRYWDETIDVWGSVTWLIGYEE